MNNTKFLVEVSSNGHYSTNATFNQQNNFAAFACGNCSYTECAGHDRREAKPINISLNFIDAIGLAIPYGKITTWGLSQTFPPYVVFGSVDSATHAITLSPAHNQANRACADRVGNAHSRHNYKILPLVR